MDHQKKKEKIEERKKKKFSFFSEFVSHRVPSQSVGEDY